MKMNLILKIAVLITGVNFLLTGCKTAVNKESNSYKLPDFSEDVETNFDGNSSIYSLQSGVQHSNAVAEAILGYYLLHGIKIPKDDEQGVRLIRSSAEQGFVHGMA